MTFRINEEVALVEHDDKGHPVEHATVYYGTMTQVREFSARARFADGTVRYFMADRQDRLWRESGRWRLVPVCSFCDMPVMGTPVEDDDDPLHRKWCSGECRDASAEGWGAQHYGAGVAT